MIADEVFNPRYRISDVVLEHICEELGRFGCTVHDHIDCDAIIYIHFSRSADAAHPHLEGELRIDRMARSFQITARYGDVTVLPASGDWRLVVEYLQKLLSPPDL